MQHALDDSLESSQGPGHDGTNMLRLNDYFRSLERSLNQTSEGSGHGITPPVQRHQMHVPVEQARVTRQQVTEIEPLDLEQKLSDMQTMSPAAPRAATSSEAVTGSSEAAIR